MPSAASSTSPLSAVAPTLDPHEVVVELAALPHRGATTAEGLKAAELLERRLEGLGARVERHAFATPRTYLPVLLWMIAGLIAGLLVAPVQPWLGTLLSAASVACGFVFLDWRWSPLMLLPPRGKATNLFATPAGEVSTPSAGRRLVLMAHYDSAPTSALYRPSMVTGFRRSMFISMGAMLVAVLLCGLEAFRPGLGWAGWLRYGLCVYFSVQALMVSVDFFRFGYTNGAADNATGVGVALATASRLWRDPLPGWQVCVLLTSAEEVNLVGSEAFAAERAQGWDRATTHVVNFDGFGAGDLRVVRSTGSITTARYDHPLVDCALEVARSDPRFASVREATWRVGDFDSLNFLRRGFPCLALTSLTPEGTIPHLHRPSDVLANVEPGVGRLAVDFTEAVLRRFGTLSAAPGSPGPAPTRGAEPAKQ